MPKEKPTTIFCKKRKFLYTFRQAGRTGVAKSILSPCKLFIFRDNYPRRLEIVALNLVESKVLKLNDKSWINRNRTGGFSMAAVILYGL